MASNVGLHAPFSSGPEASGLVQALLDSYRFKNEVNEQIRKAVVRSRHDEVIELLKKESADVNGHADVRMSRVRVLSFMKRMQYVPAAWCTQLQFNTTMHSRSFAYGVSPVKAFNHFPSLNNLSQLHPWILIIKGIRVLRGHDSFRTCCR